MLFELQGCYCSALRSTIRLLVHLLPNEGETSPIYLTGLTMGDYSQINDDHNSIKLE